MSHFENKVAIVTGGASGIGQGLCKELARRGAAMVVVADLNSEGARQVASSVTATGGQAREARVDVSHAEQVHRLVDETASAQGRLDYMFNNAGVAMCGEVRDMEIGHWQRIMDTNLWGVINGTTAAYDLMIRQGYGHIVNSASLGGLIPEPMATAYAMTKHAVVGLSTSLRAEGADLGVKVSVVCPGFVRTGALQAATFIGVKREEAIAEMSAMRMANVSKSVCAILRGVERNKAIITDAALARLLWLLHRLSPGLLDPFLKAAVNEIRVLRIES